ncbi:hypothetical protein A2W32_02245 [candidate division WWE3 bacterium RBG_16_37_10]|uniref:Type IV secretion system coupling protein TraD DNA-binding domain-containing protein n=1 Tax=candidate division WWE3 bacterium RBG_16_37_10 TaxID=1802610 RepID=A0A1F4V0K8_UNCKA|nr:MAG: hypothetical protein A2W32_02245 [candidate division WWE3 bacterium RBG_16_37_10]
MNATETLYAVLIVTLLFLIVITLFVGIVLWLLSKKRQKVEELSEYDLTFLQIKLPQQNETEIQAAEQMFSNLTGLRKSGFSTMLSGQYRISFEIVSKNTGISFYVVVPDELAGFIEKQINGAYPDAEIDIVDPNEVWDRGEVTALTELKLAGAPYYPIKNYEDLKTDTMSLISTALSKLKEDEVIAIQYIISPAGEGWRKSGQKFSADIKYKSENQEKKYRVDTSLIEGVEKKISKPGFDASIRIVSIAKDKISAETHLRNVATSFEQFTDVKYNRFVRRDSTSKKLVDDFIFRRLHTRELFIPIFEISLFRNSSVLNTAEMATVFHFPNKNVQTPNIVWRGALKSSAPTNLPTEGALYLGLNVFRGVTTKVHMLDKDRSRHFYIIGQTGTGKSEFMKTLAVQDIQNGEGLAFIDPHGSAIDDLLEKIPPERADDVIVFDASDNQRPIGLNLLEAETEEDKHIAINSFIALLYKLYDPNRQGIMGPQLERSIRNIMLTAMTDPGSTMVDVLRLLIDTKYSQTFMPKLTDPLVRRFWTDEIAKTSDFHKSEKMGYFVSKFDRFLTDITMRNILGQARCAINFNKIMAEKKILLVNLAKGKIGEENSNFLGLLLVPRILAAAFKRATLVGKSDFPNFFLYMDEFQNFATPDIATILSEARKYKLNLVVAHQFIAQLTDDIKDAVFGNVGTMAAFRIGPDDAEYLESHFQPTFKKEDLMNNPIGQCYIKLLVDGFPTPPFSMKVDWDMIVATRKDPEMARQLLETSRNKYGTPVKEVEEYVNLRAGFNEPLSPPPPPERPRIPF